MNAVEFDNIQVGDKLSFTGWRDDSVQHVTLFVVTDTTESRVKVKSVYNGKEEWISSRSGGSYWQVVSKCSECEI